MRRPIVAVAVAALILATATVAGLGIAACGGSSGSATTQAAATGPPGGGQPPEMSALFTEALDPLVEDGTITSAQETAVVTALTSSLPGAGPGQGGEGQPEEMPSHGATPQGGAPDPSRMFSSALDALVSDGTITPAQQTAISDALSSVMQRGGPGPQGGATQTQAGSSTATSFAETY